MAPTFDLWQQAYALASMSGSVSKERGDPDRLASELNKKLDSFYRATATKNAIGTWSTVWGPVVFENKPNILGVADNVMYVAANGDGSAYVVGLAGTNPRSHYDVLDEDLDVKDVTTWTTLFPDQTVPSSVSGTPYVSAGTALGLTNLLGMVDKLQCTNQTLPAFLGRLTGTSQATLVFCGHSLAGALAPTLALGLFNTGGGASLTLESWGAVYHYPTAGPTPGNAALVSFLSAVFPQGTPGVKPYQVWNANVWNSIDAVPYAWDTKMLAQIPKLYQPTWSSEPRELRDAIAWLTKQSDEGAATAGPYTMIANQGITGTINDQFRVSDMSRFLRQAEYQHTTAYDVLLGVQSLFPSGSANADAYAAVLPALLTPPADGRHVDGI